MARPRTNTPEIERATKEVRYERRKVTRALKTRLLEALDKGGSIERAAAGCGRTYKEAQGILAARGVRKEGTPGPALQMEGDLRKRLYEKAVVALEKSLEPVEQVIARNALLQTPKGLQFFLASVITHLKNTGFTAVKILEGLGDFRKGGDEVVKEIPRQALFQLPAGSHVAVRMEITTGKGEVKDGSDGRRAIEGVAGHYGQEGATAEAGSGGNVSRETFGGSGHGGEPAGDPAQGGTTPMGVAVQVGEPSGGDWADSGFDSGPGGSCGSGVVCEEGCGADAAGTIHHGRGPDSGG